MMTVLSCLTGVSSDSSSIPYPMTVSFMKHKVPKHLLCAKHDAISDHTLNMRLHLSPAIKLYDRRRMFRIKFLMQRYIL